MKRKKAQRFFQFAFWGALVLATPTWAAALSYAVHCSSPTSTYQIQMSIADADLDTGRAVIQIFEKQNQSIVLKEKFPVRAFLVWRVNPTTAEGPHPDRYIAGFRYRIGRVITFEVIQESPTCASLLGGSHSYVARVTSNQPFFNYADGRMTCESRRLLAVNDNDGSI